MALIPLNAFKSVTKKLTTGSELIYETPLTISSIILSAACSNYSNNTVSVTIVIEKPTTPTPTQYYIVPDVEIPAKDVLSAVTGRLVLEQGDKIYAFASNGNSVDFILSLNEAANE